MNNRKNIVAIWLLNLPTGRMITLPERTANGEAKVRAETFDVAPGEEVELDAAEAERFVAEGAAAWPGSPEASAIRQYLHETRR